MTVTIAGCSSLHLTCEQVSPKSVHLKQDVNSSKHPTWSAYIIKSINHFIKTCYKFHWLCSFSQKLHVACSPMNFNRLVQNVGTVVIPGLCHFKPVVTIEQHELLNQISICCIFNYKQNNCMSLPTFSRRSFYFSKLFTPNKLEAINI